MLAARQALREGAKAARVAEVGVDVEAGGGVEGEFRRLVDAPAGVRDEQDGFGGCEGGGGGAEWGVESEGGGGSGVEDGEGDEGGGGAVSVDVFLWLGGEG